MHGSAEPEEPEEDVEGASEDQGLLSRLRRGVAVFEGPEQDELLPCMPALSLQERLAGFTVCCGLGLVFSVLAWMSVFHWLKFGVLLTLGNILNLACPFPLAPTSPVCGCQRS